MGLAEDLERHIKERAIDPKELTKNLRSEFKLIMYSELHVGLGKKAGFFKRLLKDEGDRYHASEHFLNHTAVGQKVEMYLKERKSSVLPPKTRELTPVLDAIADSTSTRGLVFAGSEASSGRDKQIFDQFVASQALHVKAGRFRADDAGHFHLGAAHAARLPFTGSTPTTTQLLIKSGRQLGVVRLVVDVEGSESAEQSGLVITAGESLEVLPPKSNDPIDLVAILRKISGGRAIAVDTRLRPSPFASARLADTTSLQPIQRFFDALIFLP